MKRPPRVYVEWVDAAQVSESWVDRRRAIADGARYSGTPIVSSGFLIARRKKVIVIALSWNPHNDDVAHVLSIPRSAIVRIRRLRA